MKTVREKNMDRVVNIAKFLDGCMYFNLGQTREEFTRLKEHYLHISSSSASVESSAILNDKELFVEAAGGFRKGRAYGLGSESPIIRSQLNEHTSPTPTMIELANKVAELEERVKEKDNKYHDLEERFKEKDNKYGDICKYLKQIAEHV